MRYTLIPLTIISCILMTGCFGPDPRHQAATKALAEAPAQNRSLAAPATWKPMAPAVGHWIRLLTTHSGGEQSVSTMRVTKADATGFAYDIDTQSWDNQTLTTLQFSAVPKTSQQAIDFLQKIITIENGGSPTTVDYTTGDGAAMKKAMQGQLGEMMKAFDNMEAQLAGAPKETITVKAGTFAGCAKLTHELKMMFFSSQVTGWSHPGVPFGGLIKSTTEKGTVTELLDFGMKP